MTHRTSNRTQRRAPSTARTRQLAVEVLESRQLLSASSAISERALVHLEHRELAAVVWGQQAWAPVRAEADRIALPARPDAHRERTLGAEWNGRENREVRASAEPVPQLLAVYVPPVTLVLPHRSSVLLAEPEPGSQPSQPPPQPTFSQPDFLLVVYVSEPLPRIASAPAPSAPHALHATPDNTLTPLGSFGLTTEATVGQPPSSVRSADTRDALSPTTPVSLMLSSVQLAAESGSLVSVSTSTPEWYAAGVARDALGLPESLRSAARSAVSSANVDRLLRLTADEVSSRPLGDALSPTIEDGFIDLLSNKPRSRSAALATADLLGTPSQGTRSSAERNLDTDSWWGDLARQLRRSATRNGEGEGLDEEASATGSVFRDAAAALAMAGRLQLELPADQANGGMVVIEAVGSGYFLDPRSAPGPGRAGKDMVLVGGDGPCTVEMDAVCGRLQAFEVAEEAAATEGLPVDNGGEGSSIDAAASGRVSASDAVAPLDSADGLRDTSDVQSHHGVLVPCLLALLPQLTSRRRAGAAAAGLAFVSALTRFCRRMLGQHRARLTR
jgi:hypothetical protein